MNCDINLSYCIKNKKADIIELAIKCKIFNLNSPHIKEDKGQTKVDICKLINLKYKTDNEYKKLCIIQDV